jgi:hypothetical protein
MGASHGVGKISNFTLWPSTANFGHFEKQLSAERGVGEGTAEVLENGPRDLTGAWKKNKNYGKVIPGQEGKSGSGRVLPVATMVPLYLDNDKKLGLSGGLPDGSSAGMGVVSRLRPVAWGNASDAPTFKFLEGTGKIKSVGETLRQKLEKFNSDRLSRVGDERVQRSQSTPSARSPRNQKSIDVLKKLIEEQ